MSFESPDIQENAERAHAAPCSDVSDARVQPAASPAHEDFANGGDFDGGLAEQDAAFMALALEQAREAAALDEVPIGAVVVYEGQVIAQACNRREVDADPAGHAEFLAMKQAAQRLGVWRLSGCTVYVTLEPCLMCAGLMYQARIDRCVYGAADPKAGALGTLYEVNADERLNHTFEVTSGVREAECAEVLRTFFREKRARNKERKQLKGNE